MFDFKEVLASVNDRTLVALVTVLTGGSVPEHVIRDQAKRLRRETQSLHPGAKLAA